MNLEGLVREKFLLKRLIHKETHHNDHHHYHKGNDYD